MQSKVWHRVHPLRCEIKVTQLAAQELVTMCYRGKDVEFHHNLNRSPRLVGHKDWSKKHMIQVISEG